MIRWLAGMLAVAAVTALAVPAHAVAVESFAASGSITYTWQGDPARGCASAGLCKTEGALTLNAGGGFSGGGPVGQLIDVPIDTSGATVRVADGPGGGECIDQPSSQGGGADVIIADLGSQVVGRIEGSLSSGRCAGPRQPDLAGIVLPVTRRGGKQAVYDLSASQSFGAGPFSGTVTSTLMIRVTATGGGSGSVSSGPPPVPPPPPRGPRAHKVLLERVALVYRLASVPSASVDVAFSGEPDPFCVIVDSCAATGTLGLNLSSFSEPLMVEASRVVHRRVDARRALADLRRGRLRVSGGAGGLPGAGVSAQVAETFSSADGLRCQAAAVTDHAPLFFSVGPDRSARAAALALNDPSDIGLFRTYCPGPSDVDVLGSRPELARTSLGVAQLLARHSVISFPLSGSFAGTGYVGPRSGALEFSLSLEHVRAGTVEAMRP